MAIELGIDHSFEQDLINQHGGQVEHLGDVNYVGSPPEFGDEFPQSVDKLEAETAFFKDKKILITGGAGLIGSSIAQRLRDYECDIKVVDTLNRKYGGNIFNLNGCDNTTFIKGDVRNNALTRSLTEEADIIFHLAGQPGRMTSINHPLMDLGVNVIPSLKMLEAARKNNPGVRIIFAGSRGEYGEPAENPVTETTLPGPQDIYSIHKLTVDHYMRIYSRIYDMHTTTLRLNNVYGPRGSIKNTSYGILNLFVNLALSDQEIPIFGDGEQKRDYVYIDDVVEAFILAAQNEEAKGGTYLVGYGTSTSVIELAQKIVAAAGSGRIVHKPFPLDLAKVDINDFNSDSTKIHDELGWQAEVGLDEGIRQTVEYYRGHRDKYL